MHEARKPIQIELAMITDAITLVRIVAREHLTRVRGRRVEPKERERTAQLVRVEAAVAVPVKGLKGLFHRLRRQSSTRQPAQAGVCAGHDASQQRRYWSLALGGRRR